jgi:hypothetical protein
VKAPPNPGGGLWFPHSLAACKSLPPALCHFARNLSHERNRQRLLLQIQEVKAAPRVEVHPRRLIMFVRPQSSLQKRQSILAAWYREELRKEAWPLIETWQQRLHVRCNKLFIQAMSRPPACAGPWRGVPSASRRPSARLAGTSSLPEQSAAPLWLIQQPGHPAPPGPGRI